MMFHCSVDAKDPERVAKVVAELWGGEALEFVPMANGCWAAVSGDERGTMLEIQPYGCLMDHESSNGLTMDPEPSELVATHVAIGTVLSEEEVFAIAKREGWFARKMRRKGGFDLIELWAENRLMFEVLTPDWQKEYMQNNSLEAWRTGMARARAARDAAAAAAA